MTVSPMASATVPAHLERVVVKRALVEETAPAEQHHRPGEDGLPGQPLSRSDDFRAEI